MNTKTEKTAKGNGDETKSHCGTNQDGPKSGGTIASGSGEKVARVHRGNSRLGARKKLAPVGDMGTLAGDSGGGTGPGGAIPKGAAQAGKVAREIRLSFSPKQWGDIAAGAAFDGSTPERWARDVVLAFIPETLDAIRRANMTPAAREAEDTEAARKIAAMLPIVASQAISLSEDQTRATAICAAWEGMTFASFCRMGIFSWLECSFADMQGFATGRQGFCHAGQKEKAWARKWHKEAAPIMARLGWDGTSLQDSPAIPRREGGKAGRLGKIALPPPRKKQAGNTAERRA